MGDQTRNDETKGSKQGGCGDEEEEQITGEEEEGDEAGCVRSTCGCGGGGSPAAEMYGRVAGTRKIRYLRFASRRSLLATNFFYFILF